ERHFAAHVQAFLAVLGGIHGEAFALQARGQRFAQGCFVFDEQDTHGSTPVVGHPGVYRLPIQSSSRRVRGLPPAACGSSTITRTRPDSSITLIRFTERPS